MALASNRSLAEHNLDMKPRVESGKERLVAKYNELEEVRERYKKHCTLRGKRLDILKMESIDERLEHEKQ